MFTATVFIVMMVVMFMFTVAVFIVVMVVMFMFTVFIVMMVMMMFMFTAAVFIVVMVMMFNLACKLFQFCFKRIFLFQQFKNLCTCQLFPGGCKNICMVIVAAEKLHAGSQLTVRSFSCMAEDYCIGTFNLIVEKFAKVFHIHFAFIYVYNCSNSIECNIRFYILHCTDNIAEFAHAGWLDNHTVRGIITQHLSECLAKIAHQTAADTARVHLCNIYACILQKTAINTDIAKFVFYKHQLFSCISFGNKLFDKCCFTCTEKA